MERIRVTNAGPLILASPINLLAIVASSARSTCKLKYLFNSILPPFNFIKSVKVLTAPFSTCRVIKGAVTKQPLKSKKLLVDYMKSTNNFCVFLSQKGSRGSLFVGIIKL